MLQIYCLMFRVVVLLPSPRVYRVFMSKPVLVAFIFFGQLVGLTIGYFNYITVVQSDVS
jgi:hypothetical protein